MSANDDAPVCRFDEAGDHAQGRCLAAAGRPEERYQLSLWNRQIEGCDGDGVTVQFSDGSTVRYDVVVGADGLYSTTRAMLFPEARGPELTGQGVWRYNFPREPGLDPAAHRRAVSATSLFASVIQQSVAAASSTAVVSSRATSRRPVTQPVPNQSNGAKCPFRPLPVSSHRRPNAETRFLAAVASASRLFAGWKTPSTARHSPATAMLGTPSIA